MTRRTIAQPAGPLTGLGVRSGQEITVRLLPAEPGAGLLLHRTDLGALLPLHLDYALDMPNCTAVGHGSQDAVLFVEHLLAVLHVWGITDLQVEVSGPEIPLLDGSARPWDDLLTQAGCQDLPGSIAPLRVWGHLRVADGDRWIVANPAGQPEFRYELSYEHPLIGQETATFCPHLNNFGTDLAPARTFALVEEIQAAQAAGVLRGGGPDNCRIVYPDRLSAPPTLPQEFARHKLLDMLGDLYLLGRPVIGQIVGHRTGHAHNRWLLRQLAACGTL